VKRYLQQFMKSSGPSRDQPWRACFGIRWRRSNGFLRTMVTTIHKLNTGWLAFLRFLSESEMRSLGGTPYRSEIPGPHRHSAVPVCPLPCLIAPLLHKIPEHRIGLASVLEQRW
jgi:hypothetical protein